MKTRSEISEKQLKEFDYLADAYDYRQVQIDNNTGMVSYFNGLVRLNIYTTKMTVCICYGGKTKVVKHVSMEMLEDIFAFPEKQ